MGLDIMGLLKLLDGFLGHSTIAREAAAKALGKMSLRREAHVLIKDWITAACVEIEAIHEDDLKSFRICGLLESIKQVYKHGVRE